VSRSLNVLSLRAWWSALVVLAFAMGRACALPPPVCPGDADGDGLVSFSDITASLANWGGAGPSGDATGNCSVDFGDVTASLANWGASCPMPRLLEPGTTHVWVSASEGGTFDATLEVRPTFVFTSVDAKPFMCYGYAPAEDPPLLDPPKILPWVFTPEGPGMIIPECPMDIVPGIPGIEEPRQPPPATDWDSDPRTDMEHDRPGGGFAPGWPADPSPGSGPGGNSGALPSAPSGPSIFGFSGEVALNAVDVRIPGRGIDFVFARVYRSRVQPDAAQSRFGHGWDHACNIYLEACGPDRSLHDGLLARDDRYRLQPDGTWSAPEFFRVVSINPDQTYTLTFANGLRWNFNRLDGSAAQGRIASMVDRNGNTILYQYDGLGRLVTVRDTLDWPTSPRAITFAYNADGRIHTITDWTNRQWRYEYYGPADAGGSAGDLRSVRTPIILPDADYPFPASHAFPAGRTTVYTYTRGFTDDRLNHNLLTVTDPNGRVPVSAAYAGTANSSDLNFDRCVRLTVGDQGPAGDNLDLHYSLVAPSPPPNVARILCTVNDPVGNVTEYSYDALNRLVRLERFTGRAPDPDAPTTDVLNRPVNPLRPADPPSYITTAHYSDDALPTAVTFPNQNQIQYTYDSLSLSRRSRGNLLTVMQLPGPLGGAQSQIINQFTYSLTHNFVETHMDGRGNITRHFYDPAGNRVQTIHRLPSIVETWSYNAFGQVETHTWPDNGVGYLRRDDFLYYGSAFGYAYGYLRRATLDAAALMIRHSFTYNRVGTVIQYGDPRGFDTLLQRNQLIETELVSLSLMSLNSVRFEHEFFRDANGNLIRHEYDNYDDQHVLQPDANWETLYSYDTLNNVLSCSRERAPGLFVTETYLYDANRNRTRVNFGEAVNGNDPFNNLTIIYDERNLPFREVRAAGSPGQSSKQIDYDGNGNLARTRAGIESAPRDTLYVFDGYDRLIRTTDPMGNVTIDTHDANSNVVNRLVVGELTDAPGAAGNVRLRETSSIYDAMDRRIEDARRWFDPQTQLPIDDGLSRIDVTWTDAGGLRSLNDDRGSFTSYTYDTMLRPLIRVDPRGNTLQHFYDPNSNLVRVESNEQSDLFNPPQLFAWGYAYDELNRRTQTIEPGGYTHQYFYDSLHRLVRRIDARGNVERYVYDGLNRRVQTVHDLTNTGDGSGFVFDQVITHEQWDDSSRLVAQTDDNGNSTRYAYDSLDRRVVTQLPDGTVHQTGTGASWPLGFPSPDLTLFVTGYNVHSNTTTSADANGSVTFNSFDLLDRIVSRTVARGPGVLGTTFEQYAYDGLSRLVRAENNDSVDTWTYDSLSNDTRETQQVTGGPVRTISSAFDGAGNEARVVHPGGRTIDYAYDALDRVVRTMEVGAPIALHFYAGPDRVERRVLLNNVQSDYTHDAARDIVRIVHSRFGAPIDDLNFGRDAMHNKTFADNLAFPQPPFNRTYTYDSMDRLVRSVAQTGPNPPENRDYQLDGVNNVLSIFGTGPDIGPFFMDATLPTPADFQVNQYTNTPFDQRLYDVNGNLTRTQSGLSFRQYSYDYRNRLVQSFDSLTGQTTTYRYDCLGRRLERVTAGSATRFYYNDWREIEVQNIAHATFATNVWGHGLDELLNVLLTGQHFYFVQDDLNNVTAATISPGTVVERYAYGDYGKPTFMNGSGSVISNTSIGNPHLFAGRRFDTPTAFYYIRMRYLDPRAGRYITRDPASAWHDAAPLALGNGYVYAGGNPVSFFEPMGCVLFQDADEIAKIRKEIDAILSKKKLTQADIDRLKELLDKLVGEGTGVDVSDIERIQKILDKVPGIGLPGKVLKAYFKWMKAILDLIIKGIKDIDEEQYKKYKELRDNGAKPKDLEGWRSKKLLDRYERRYQAEKLKEKLDKLDPPKK
jgi:RHS repeat-associated protein